jgi:hypothetical protein
MSYIIFKLLIIILAILWGTIGLNALISIRRSRKKIKESEKELENVKESSTHLYKQDLEDLKKHPDRRS